MRISDWSSYVCSSDLLRTGDRSFTFTNDSILEWSEPIGGWKIIALIPQIIEPYRWTAGYLNGVIYFCHPRTGILELDLDTGVCQPIQATGLPSQPRAITVNQGRLVVLTDQVLAWSWQSDGRNFTPALGEAGAQVISARKRSEESRVGRACVSTCRYRWGPYN